MAGYSATPLQKKLGIKPGQSVIFFNELDHYRKILGPLPDDLTFLDASDKEEADFVHAFALNHSQLFSGIFTWKSMLKRDGMLWISWPKKSSSINSDLSGDIVRETSLASAGLVDIKVCTVDEDWSGLKFVYRVKDR